MTTVEYRTGDLFAQEDIDAIGHGVNLAGLMGSGIARIFKQKHPRMESEYRSLCKEELLPLGGVFVWKEEDSRQLIFNIATQVLPGANALLSAVEVGMINAVREAEYQRITSLAIPEIGCGIGGLNLTDVKEILERVSETTNVKIVMVSLPQN